MTFGGTDMDLNYEYGAASNLCWNTTLLFDLETLAWTQLPRGALDPAGVCMGQMASSGSKVEFGVCGIYDTLVLVRPISWAE